MTTQETLQESCTCQHAELEAFVTGLEAVGVKAEGQELQRLLFDEFKRVHPCDCYIVPLIDAKFKLVEAGLYTNVADVPDHIANGIIKPEDRRAYTTEEKAQANARYTAATGG